MATPPRPLSAKLSPRLLAKGTVAALLFAPLVPATLEAQEQRREMPPPRGPAPLMVKVPYAGFRSEQAPDVLSHHLPIPRGFGLIVTEVLQDSPAGKAGIQRHDILLLADDQRLVNPGQLEALLRARKPGEKMRFTIFRAGKEWESELTLWEAEEPEGRPGARHGAFWEKGGEIVQRLGEKVRRFEGPELDLNKSAAFSRELLEKTERLGDEALRIFRELEPFQFPTSPAAPPHSPQPERKTPPPPAPTQNDRIR